MSTPLYLSAFCLALQLFNGLGSCAFIPEDDLLSKETLSRDAMLDARGKSTVCEDIAAVLQSGKVAYPSTAQYNSSLENYYAAQESALEPGCFVRPTSAEDVSKTVKVLAKAYNLDRSQKFAFKSGGHTSWAGAANIEDGVTIDLGSLNATTLSKDKRTAAIGPGATWGQVYKALDPYGLSVTGGRVAAVGVGGLTLGGGISFFSPKQGFACDNVQEFEVVLADGRIVQASALRNRDLWLALKGGSSNFGIVTKITTSTFSQGLMWGGSLTHSASTAPQQLKALADFSGLDYDLSASLISTHTYTNLGGSDLNVVSNNLEYDKPTPYPASYKQFTDIPHLSSTLRTDTLYNMSVELGASTPDGRRQFEMSMTYENDLELLERTYALFNGTKPQIKNAKDIVWLLIFEPIPVQLTSRSLPKGGNVLGLESNTKPLMLVLVQAIWANEEDDDNIIGTMKGLFRDIQGAARDAGKLNRYQYLNYADESQDPISTYGPANKAFLQVVSKKYDPQGFWQRAAPGGFKLF